jgi:hypothetical protein
MSYLIYLSNPTLKFAPFGRSAAPSERPSATRWTSLLNRPWIFPT